MQAAKVQASLRIRAVSPEPPLLAHTSSESRGTFRQKARSLAPLNGWACAVKICHDGMLEDTNLLDRAHFHQTLQINLSVYAYTGFEFLWLQYRNNCRDLITCPLHIYQSFSCAISINTKNQLRGVSGRAVEESKMCTFSRI